VLWAAARLARRLGAALHVVHALELVGMPLREALRGGVSPHRRRAEEALEEHLARAIPAGMPLASRVIAFGSAPDAVEEHAHALGAELVILGPAAEHAGAGLAPRGTLLAITSHVAVPCLVLKASFDLPLERVMLPLSATAAGLAALGEACAWLAALGRAVPTGSDAEAVTELEVLHVARRFAEWREIAQELDREVGAVNERLPWHGPLRLYPSVRWGVTSEEEILLAVAEQRPSLVILGPGGRVMGEGAGEGASPGTLLDEVACSVLLMPEPLMPETELLQSASSAAAAGGA
jgi:hypothetical protein